MTDVVDVGREVPEEEQGSVGAFDALLARLSRRSVDKHFEAYRDIPWDDPAFAIDPADPRWELTADDPLGATEWYQRQSQPVRARIGLQGTAMAMKAGLQFESVLKRGLLEYAIELPNNSPEFRYAYHEVIEEAQHSLMFQEFVNRTGLPVGGLPKIGRWAAGRVVKLGRRFPELFFVFVLGGEDPIDHVQRRALRSQLPLHPLLERIMRIHVTEEARHLSFARHYLKTRVPALSRRRRLSLSLQAPIILGVMAGIMMQVPPQMIWEYRIPVPVIRAAYSKNPEHRAQVIESLGKVRNLLDELGLITRPARPLWRALGLLPAVA